MFMHPQQAEGTTQNNPRMRGRGGGASTIGNPLETTVFLSHLIFEGTLDRFPGLGFAARTQAATFPLTAAGRMRYAGGAAETATTAERSSESRARYSRYQLYIDSMIFHEEGLRHLVEEVGASFTLDGTDYPDHWPVGIDFILNARFLNNAQKEAILEAAWSVTSHHQRTSYTAQRAERAENYPANSLRALRTSSNRSSGRVCDVFSTWYISLAVSHSCGMLRMIKSRSRGRSTLQGANIAGFSK